MPEDKLPIPQFAAKIKAKYPEYKDVNDTLLVKRIVEKYPEYKESVDLSGLEEPVKKKETALPLGGKVGSSVGRLDVGAGITEIDDKGKPVGGALSRVSGITTPEQAKISRVNKAFGKIESFAGSREDFEEIYKQAPQEFDNLAKQVAPNVNKGEIDKFYTTEAARKDAYVDRVLQSYNQQKTKAQLESARRYRPVIESQFSTATIPLSNYTGKQYQLPQSEAQVSEILSDLNNEKEKLKTELTTNWNLSEVQTKAKELSEIEAAIRQNLTYQVGRMALERLSQNNPNVTSKDIGKEIFRVLHPDEYDLYEKVGGDKPVSFTVGTQRDTPVEADALNEQMVKLGNEIKRMYGNETAIQDADIEEQTAKRKYTFQRQAQVKQKIAAILHERGLSPDKATEELKDKVVNKYLPDEDKEIWYNNNKVYNNVDLPSTGLGYSFKNDFNSFVKDAVSSTFGFLLPNRQKARAAEVLAESSESKLLGEDPQYKARLGQLKAKEEQIGLSDKEKEEKESLETYTNIRSKWEKRFDLAGTGLGTIMAMGTVSAFTGGLLNARNIPTAIKSLIAPSQASMRGRLATSVLTFYESNARNALKEYPNDKDWFKRGLKAGLDTAVDSLTEMLFPEEKILSGIGKREVAKMVSNLTAKNLNATLNSNVFKDIARAMIGGSKRLVAVPLQEGAEELIAATLKEAYDGAINPDPDRQALDIKQMIEIGENTLWSSGLLGVPKALFGGKSNKVPLNALWDSVSTQDGYITQKMTIERLKRDGELTEAKDRLDNLELGRNEYLNNPILSGDMGGLDAGQKQNYFARILNEAILKKQADAVTDPNLKKRYEQQIKESEAIREKIYKGEIKVTPENEELTKEEFEKQQKIDANKKISELMPELGGEKELEQQILDQDRVLGDEESELTPEQKIIQQAIDNNEVEGMFLDMAKAAVADPQQAKQLLDEAKSQVTGQVAGELGSARSGVEKAFGKTIADFVAPKEESVGGGVGGDVKSTTPIKDKWQERVDSIDVENEYTDLNELKVGDVIITKTGTLGFVKKINPKKVIIESTYGGWGGNDIELTELSVNKSEISKFKKPKAGSGGVGGDVEERFTAKGGNKVVDDKGEPLIVYHGSRHEFDEFTNSGGVYFSANKDIANQFANPDIEGITPEQIAGKPTIHEAIISLRNPLVLDDYSEVMSIGYNEDYIDELKKEGYDGVMDVNKESILVFDKSQIKKQPQKTIFKLKEQTKAETPTPTDKVGEQPKSEGSKEREDWSRDVESTAKALEEVDKTPINRLNALSNAEKIDKGSGSQVRYMSLADLNELARDMIANEKDYQDKLQDAQGVYNLTIERIEEISESYHKSKKDGTNPELVKAVEDLLGKPTQEPTPQPTKAKELADKGIGKYEKKAREIADKIQKSELPDWLKADLPDGTKKAGASYDQLKKALADAVIEMGRLLDRGVEYSQAIKQAVKELVSLQGEKNRDTIEKGFEKYYTDQTQQEPPPPQTPKQEPKEVGIKHKETEAIRQRYGLPEYEMVGGKTNAELEAEADRLISEGYDIDKLIKKIEDGTPPTGVENYILTKYIGNLEAKFAKDKSDETLKELKRLLDATDRIGSLQSEAFRTRKAMSPADDSLASFFIKEMDSLGVDELTQEQKATITKEYEEIKATNDALQKKIVELEKQMAEMEAKQKVSDEAKRIVRGRKTKQQFNEERKKIIGNIREKLRKAKGETQATVVPYLKELIVIAPDVAKLVKNLVEEGVTNLADIVDNIHEYLKDEIDGIQKKDVVDLIAGVYNEKKPTRNELAKKLFDLKAEAKLLNRYAELVEGKEPASEKKKIQRNKELSDLRKKIKESDITKLSQVKEKYKTQIAELEQKIKDGDFSKPEPKKKIKLDKEGQQLRDKLIKLKQQRDARILLNQRVNETKKQRGLRLFAEVLNIPRTLMTIGDFSGLLRQGIFGISHPSMMANASKQMFKTAFSQKEYDRWFADLKEDPRFYAMKESKLSIADSLSHDLSEREEVFMSTLAEKIPIVGQTLTIKGKKVIPGLNIVKGSERSYTALLNKMRVDLFNYFADSMEARGLTVENAPKQYKAMAEYINNATGRSDFGKHLNRIAPILNSVFFSPRLIASRVNMLTYFMQPRFWKTLPREARIDYFRSWASLLSIGLTILALAQAGGADVEDDPRSSDFGKIKSGDTRWDIWGGAQPYIRVFAQVLSGKRKSTNSGEIYELTGDDAFGETRAGVVSDFFRGKLAPVPASMVDVLSGRTTTGDKIVYEFETDGVKEVAIDNYIMERLLPMTITGTREAMKERGASAILTVGVPSVFGVGTQTYGKPIKEVRDEVEYEGVKIKLTKEQYLEYRNLANKYINENVEKLKSLKEYQQIEDRDERLGIERSVKNYSVKKAEQEIIDKYESTFKDTEELKDKAKEKKEKREDILEQIKD